MVAEAWGGWPRRAQTQRGRSFHLNHYLFRASALTSSLLCLFPPMTNIFLEKKLFESCSDASFLNILNMMTDAGCWVRYATE